MLKVNKAGNTTVSGADADSTSEVRSAAWTGVSHWKELTTGVGLTDAGELTNGIGVGSRVGVGDGDGNRVGYEVGNGVGNGVGLVGADKLKIEGK